MVDPNLLSICTYAIEEDSASVNGFDFTFSSSSNSKYSTVDNALDIVNE